MIAAFTRFDLHSWFPRRQTLLTLMFVVAVGIFLPVPGMAILTAAIVTSLMVSTPFLGDERGRLDLLYGVLPITRSTVVIGRALALLVYGFAAALLATAITFATAAARGQQVSSEFLLVALAGAAALTGLAMALQLPVLFRVGYSRGRLISYAPAMVLVAAAWIAQAIGVLGPVQKAATQIPIEFLVIGGIGTGTVGVIVGTSVAAWLYRGRTL